MSIPVLEHIECLPFPPLAPPPLSDNTCFSLYRTHCTGKFGFGPLSGLVDGLAASPFFSRHCMSPLTNGTTSTTDGLLFPPATKSARPLPPPPHLDRGCFSLFNHLRIYSICSLTCDLLPPFPRAFVGHPFNLKRMEKDFACLPYINPRSFYFFFSLHPHQWVKIGFFFPPGRYLQTPEPPPFLAGC